MKLKTKTRANGALISVLAREIAPSKGIKLVEWLLLTTLDVETAEEAFEKVRWYSCKG